MKTREQSIADAIQFIKTCPYKGTAIKVELEAQLDRPDGGDHCGNCDGEGWLSGVDEECSACEGSGESKEWDEDTCQEFIEANVSKKAKDNLIYGRFYRDGSVDSEYTFTVKIDHPEVVIEYINAFSKLAEAIGNGLDTDGAGMHIAILNSRTGNYPSGNSLDSNCRRSFKIAMHHFLPALYFLGSPDHKSRPLRFRMPQVSSDKYSAINYGNGVFEYRFFETCYQRPEAFFDMLCVIANTLKFYTPQEKSASFFDTIGEIGFKEGGNSLSRFYYTEKHIDALNKGLRILKPAYKTMDELRKERGFNISKTKLAELERKKTIKYKMQYREYVDRRKGQLKAVKEGAVVDWQRIIRDEERKLYFEAKYRDVQGYIDRLMADFRIISEEEFIKDKLRSANSCAAYVTI